MPIQPSGAKGIKGWIDLDPAYTAGLQDLEGFSHIILLYCFNQSQGYQLQTKPFLEEITHGVFATRALRRPNPIGLSIVKLNGIRGSRLMIENVDILDGTPLLDIKPYVAVFDQVAELRSG